MGQAALPAPRATCLTPFAQTPSPTAAAALRPHPPVLHHERLLLRLPALLEAHYAGARAAPGLRLLGPQAAGFVLLGPELAAALLAFLALRGWTHALRRLGIACRPFTRQENTVVQTCGVACSGIAFSGT